MHDSINDNATGTIEILENHHTLANAFKLGEKTMRVRSGIHSEGGQAIVEMTVGLIGIMTAFAGLLYISTLGVENIRVMVTARENADVNSNPQGRGRQITTWDYSSENKLENGVIFTTGNTAKLGDAPDASNFTEQVHPSGLPSHPEHYDPEFMSNVYAGSNIFLDAVNLRAYTGDNDQVEERLESDLMQGIETVFGLKGNINFNGQECNRIYMPQRF